MGRDRVVARKTAAQLHDLLQIRFSAYITAGVGLVIRGRHADFDVAARPDVDVVARLDVICRAY
jgi:head-tail adaptor